MKEFKLFGYKVKLDLEVKKERRYTWEELDAIVRHEREEYERTLNRISEYVEEMDPASETSATFFRTCIYTAAKSAIRED